MVYTVEEAQTKLQEILQKVRAGERVVIAQEGEELAEIRPLADKARSLPAILGELQEAGILGPLASPQGSLAPLARKPGALARFLESRD